MAAFEQHNAKFIQRLVCVVLATLAIAPSAGAADNTLKSLTPFLEHHCFECHGAKKQENDQRFDTLGTTLSKLETLESWQGILDQLNQGTMPPEDRPQPSEQELSKAVEAITAELKHAYSTQRSTGGQTVMRRLNRIELRNTIRDLLYLHGPEFRIDNVSRLVDNNGNGSVANTSKDPFRHFPEDEGDEGFKNTGKQLVMSDFFLKLMIAATEESLAMATHSPDRPSIETRQLTRPITIADGQNWGGTLESHQRKLQPDYDAIYRRYHRFARLRPDAFRRGVGFSAKYRITIEASAHNQKHTWGELIKTDQDEPLRLGLHMVDHRNERSSTPLAAWDVPADGKMHRFTFETWLDQSWLPWLGWENGPNHRDVVTERIVERFHPDRFRPSPDRRDQKQKEQYTAWQRDMAAAVLQDGYAGPHLRIHELTLEPLIDQWPPKSHTQLYGASSPADADVEALLLAFARRAYRRPVTKEEIAPITNLVRHMMGDRNEGTSSGVCDLTYKVYKGSWTKLPDFGALKALKEDSSPHGLIDIRLARMDEHYGLVFEGQFNVAEQGLHRFEVASDDGSRLKIDGTTVINHDGLHGASTKKGEVQLEAGVHKLRVEYFAFGKPNSLRVSWSPPGQAPTQLTPNNSAKSPVIATDARSAKAMQALQAGYTAILCSPNFLYLQEPSGKLTDYAIASRLSYFLWSSMPDEELMTLASNGQLVDPKVIEQQVERMLNDPKAEAFIRGFTSAWLRLDKLGKMPPERGGPFRFYHDRGMEPQLIAQTAAYFADILKTNGHIDQFIESDFQFMNEEIANWFYGRNDVTGSRMQKVLVSDPRRGGIFTQPSVMTATSNGVDTSPVVRGVWILENVLGTPPSPPPPDVEPLPTDLREATTIREQLALHRKHEACNSCHRKIDPMGFAFENFDPVGRWRDRYPKAKDNIDTVATMADGREIADIVEFKQMLLSKQELVTRCLTEKLLTYASGRELEPTDRGAVDQIVEKLEQSSGGLRDLVKLVVRSEIFLTK